MDQKYLPVIGKEVAEIKGTYDVLALTDFDNFVTITFYLLSNSKKSAKTAFLINYFL